MDIQTASKGSDSADCAVTGIATCHNIVVTQDFDGLAAMVLAKGASAIDQNGMVTYDLEIASPLTSFTPLINAKQHILPFVNCRPCTLNRSALAEI